MRKLFLLWFSFLFGFSMHAAETDNAIENISVSQGLPNPQVNQIFRSSNGIFWVGTSNGLSMFDGYSFTVLQSIPFDSTSLADDNILKMAEDRNGNIWLVTRYGIEVLPISDPSVMRLKYLPDYGDVVGLITFPASDFTYIVFSDRILKINVYSFQEEEVRFNNELHIKAAVGLNDNVYILAKDCIAVFESHNHRISYRKFDKLLSGDEFHINFLNNDYFWFSAGKTAYSFNLSTGVSIPLFEANGVIRGLSQLVNNTAVAATQNSAYQLTFDRGFRNTEAKIVYNSGEIYISSVVQDDNKLIWLATNKGIFKINPHSSIIKHKTYAASRINQKYSSEALIESLRAGILIKESEGKYMFYSSLTGEVVPVKLSEFPTACLLSDNILYIGTQKGLLKYDIDARSMQDEEIFSGCQIHAMYQLDDTIWISTNKGLYGNAGKKFKLLCPQDIMKFLYFNNTFFYTGNSGFGALFPSSCSQKLFLNEKSSSEYMRIADLLQSYDGKIWLATDDGLYRFNPQKTTSDSGLFNLVFKGKVYSLVEAKDLPEVWFATDLGIGAINYQKDQLMFLGYEDGIRQTSFVTGGAFMGTNGNLNFLTQDEILSFNPDSVFRNNHSPDVFIASILLVRKDFTEQKLFFNKDTLLIAPDTRYFLMNFTTNDYFSPLHTIFEYSLEPLHSAERWQKLTGNKLMAGRLEPGNYLLKVRAINSHGYLSQSSRNVLINVKSPILSSRWAFLLYSALLILFVFLLIRYRTRYLLNINREYRERERIAKKIEQQKEELTLKNKNITDSINYARRIQIAMMPSVRHFKAVFEDSFILHMPKDIVSGDFFWVNHANNKIFFSAADCTGHGVPGAFMSIIGVELFRRIIEIEKIYTPAEILNGLSKHLERVFGDVDEMKLRDGMDLAFCSINDEHTLLEFAGAFNSLYIIRDSSIIEIRGDRYSVGVYPEDEKFRSFNNHVLPLQDGDLIYVFTDGFVDQFGGPEGKKYKYRRFRHLLLALHQLPLAKQEEFLRKSILEWKGDLEQVDDILVMGLRIRQQKQ